MALSANAVSQAMGIANAVCFTFTTDATAAVKTYLHCGFVPRFVKFANLTDRIVDEYFAGQAADAALHHVAAGTMTLVSSGGITLENNTAVSVALSVIMPDNTLVLKPATGGIQYVMGFSVPAALMVASKQFSVLAIG